MFTVHQKRKFIRSNALTSSKFSMQKTLTGEVIESRDSSFDEMRENPITHQKEPTGKRVTLWQIVICTDPQKEEISSFHISQNSLLYREAQEIKKGEKISIIVDANYGIGDRIKWIPLEFIR